jgi:hypothetical protein
MFIKMDAYYTYTIYGSYTVFITTLLTMGLINFTNIFGSIICLIAICPSIISIKNVFISTILQNKIDVSNRYGLLISTYLLIFAIFVEIFDRFYINLFC